LTSWTYTAKVKYARGFMDVTDTQRRCYERLYQSIRSCRGGFSDL